MTKDNLLKIKTVYDQMLNGISNPVLINEAYTLLPVSIEGTPMRGKMQAINRYVMFNYNSIMAELSRKEEPEVIEESIGTIENKPLQSHSEDNNVVVEEQEELMTFLTEDEKQDLKSDTAGTQLEIVDEKTGSKRRTRGKDSKAN